MSCARALGAVLVLTVLLCLAVVADKPPRADRPAGPCRSPEVGRAEPSHAAASPTSSPDRSRGPLPGGWPKLGLSQGFQLLDLDPAARDALLEQMRLAGARAVRIDLPWARVQPCGPDDDDFAGTLAVYDSALAHGLMVLPVTTGLPAWAGSTVPQRAASYQTFLEAAGRHLIPRGITTVELWNEANISGMSPVDYTTKVLVPGATGWRRAGEELGRTVTVVSSGLAPSASRGSRWSAADFVRGMYDAGARGYFDVLGTHPYVWPNDPAVPGPHSWMLKTRELHALMVAHGDADKPVWATEFGVPTNAGKGGASEQEQAVYLARGVAVWQSFAWAGPLFVYSFRDLGGSPTNPEAHFGVLRADGTAKPALTTLRQLLAGD